jgi:hypothetical protein
MIRSLFAASAAMLFGAGVESAQAQCDNCARPATASVVHTAPGVKYAIPMTAPQPVSTSAPAACPNCVSGPAMSSMPNMAAMTTTLPVKAEKEVTLTGTLVCAKCGLKEPGVKTCTNALQVKDGEMTVTYYLSDKGNGETYHEGLCGGGTKAGAKVTGTVTEKDGRRWLTASKVEEKK